MKWLPPRGRVLPTGLTHVATVSFLASRAAPSLQFFFALGGGIALARAARTRGARVGYGAALASMLQTVAVMGPARISAPLTQAITAPMMGRLQDRGVRPLTEFAACLALRLVHYAVMLAVFIYVILGWVIPPGYSPPMALLASICEPVLAPVRRMIPPIGGIDFSPLWVGLAFGVLLRLVPAV